ncbi:hypothetical protein SynPROSU1_01874 [Synechococcus sp. PROS-U-1]|nr:hypothetical protein SynPROSU1_01874 [Synechococcus sp. PROS-U-1]
MLLPLFMLHHSPGCNLMRQELGHVEACLRLLTLASES